MLAIQVQNAKKFEALFNRAGKNPLEKFSTVKMTAKGYMDLHIDQLACNADGSIRFSFTHYGEQNGDKMADPDMEMVYHPAGSEASRLVAMTYQNDYAAVYAKRGNGSALGDPVSLDSFLGMWLDNLLEQGHV